MKHLLIGTVLFNLNLWAVAPQPKAKTPTTLSSVRYVAESYTRKEMMTALRDFIKAGAPARMPGTPGHLSAQDWLKEAIQKMDPFKTGTFEAISFTPDVDAAKAMYEKDLALLKAQGQTISQTDMNRWSRFTETMVKEVEALRKVPGQNLVWRKPGINTQKLLLILAHYDTISHDKSSLLIKHRDSMPGADYNASGVVAALGMIKTFAQISFNYSVEVAFTDESVFGLLGARAMAQQMIERKKKGEVTDVSVISLEMLGHDTETQDKTKRKGNFKAYLPKQDSPVSLASHKFFESLNQKSSKIVTKIQITPEHNNFTQSDHSVFWDEGMPAFCLSQDWENDFNDRNYHTPQDLPETLNQETLYNSYLWVTTGVGGQLLDLSK